LNYLHCMLIWDAVLGRPGALESKITFVIVIRAWAIRPTHDGVQIIFCEASSFSFSAAIDDVMSKNTLRTVDAVMRFPLFVIGGSAIPLMNLGEVQPVEFALERGVRIVCNYNQAFALWRHRHS